MLDQASNLRKMIKNIDDKDDNTRIFSVISGKPGVGKTRFASNLESKFMELGKKVIVLDENSDYIKAILQLNKYDEIEKQKTINSLLRLSDYEIVIINNSDGLSQESLDFTKLAHEVILVTRPSAEVMTETYKFLKVLNQEGIKEKVKIFVNNDENTENQIFYNLNKTVKRFLDIILEDITDLDNAKLAELLYDSESYDTVQLRDKIIDIFGG